MCLDLCPYQCEIEAMSSSLSSSDTKSLRLSKEVSSLESQLNDAKVTKRAAVGTDVTFEERNVQN